MNYFTDIRERRLKNLKARFEKSKLSQKAFAEKYKIPYSQMNQWLGSKKGFGEKAARELEEKLGLDPLDLDRDPAIENIAEAKELFSRKIPLISWVAAGDWETAENPHELGDCEEMYSSYMKHSKHSYCLRVVGDSMFNAERRPSYFSGDIIVVDPEQAGDATNHSPVIARLMDSSLKMEQRVTFKLLIMDGPQSYLAPINKSYSNIYEPFEVIGLVLHGIYK